MIPVAFQLAAATTMHVGAVVVRPPVVTVEHGLITVRASDGIIVAAEGGRVARGRDGSFVIAPDGPLVRIVLTY